MPVCEGSRNQKGPPRGSTAQMTQDLNCKRVSRLSTCYPAIPCLALSARRWVAPGPPQAEPGSRPCSRPWWGQYFLPHGGTLPVADTVIIKIPPKQMVVHYGFGGGLGWQGKEE